MATVQFTKEEFRDVLDNIESGGEPWQEGWEFEQVIYTKMLSPFAKIKVMTSIGHHGVARDTGKDSIRFAAFVLYSNGNWVALKKEQAWTQRIPGWEDRVTSRLVEMIDRLERIKRPIPFHCNQPMWLNFAKSKANPGRPWCRCGKCGERLYWMDEALPEEEEDEDTNQDGEMPETEPEVDDIFSALSSTSIPQPKEKEEWLPFVHTGNGYGPNAEQLSIINSDPFQATVVPAPPGSGKTYTLENLIVHLIKNGARPGSILYCTLSRDMAEEGAVRIKKALEEQGVNLSPFELEEHERWWTTIHAACNRMKADWTGEKQDVIPEYMVKKFLNGDDKNSGIIDHYWFGPKEQKPPWDEVYNLIQGAKTLGLTSGHDLEYFCGVCGNENGIKLHKVRCDFDDAMQYNVDRRNRPQPYTTFSDMLLWVHSMLVNDQGFRSRWQGQFKFVINDEGQDTTKIQMEILSILADAPTGNQTTVGDVNQMLFRFAGASPETNVGDGFERTFPDAERKFLKVNYRSKREIVDAANRLIAYNYQQNGGPYSDDLFEPMAAFRGDGGVISYQEFNTPEEESRYILEVMERDNLSPRDVFVIARTKKQLALAETFFLQAGIPYINRAGSGFWGSSWVGATVAYLRLALDPAHDESYKKCYNIPTRSYGKPRYLGKQFLEHSNNSYEYLVQHRSRVEKHHWGYKYGVADLIGFVNDIRRELQDNTFVDVLQYIIDESIYPWLVDSKGEDSAGKPGEDEGDGSPKPLHDLMLMKSIAKGFETVEEFFEMVDKAASAAEASKDKSLWDDYAILSTVHRIKGQERPVVFVIGVSEGEKLGNDQPVGLMPHTFSLVPPPPKFLYNPAMTIVEDERCICYVAVTRAKDKCYLSSSVEHPVTEGCVMRPSRFIYEMGLLENT